MDSPASRSSRKRPAPSSPDGPANAPPTIGPSYRNIFLILVFSALVGAAQYYSRIFHVLLAPGAGGPAAVVASLLGSSAGDKSAGANAKPIPCEKQMTSAGRKPGIAHVSPSESIAESIIHASYDATYAKLAAMSCPKSQPAGNCYRILLRRNPTATNEPPFPWWFRTMLQESAIITSQWWMMLKSNDPPLRQCQLPKVGSKQWSVFIHMMNGDPNPHKPDAKNTTNSWNERGRNDAGPKFVVLRDPLERYLSAFLDKCVNPKNAWQKHCEPWEIFNADPGNKVMTELKGNHRVLFQAFVHASPLKWNMHFLPQALLCDGLYRTIKEYHYVARMGRSFYSDLQEMGQMFGKKADGVIQDIFDYKTKLKEEKGGKNRDMAGNRQGSPHGIEMKASEKVLEYYTPELVRKVLEYTAIDYVLLNMTIPDWAEEMLRQAEEK